MCIGDKEERSHRENSVATSGSREAEGVQSAKLIEQNKRAQ